MGADPLLLFSSSKHLGIFCELLFYVSGWVGGNLNGTDILDGEGCVV